MKYLTLTLLIAFATNISAQTSKLDKLKWMQGTWVMKAGSMQFIESWQPTANDLWQGSGCGINTAGDTVFKESLQLAIQNDTVWYLPTVANQNEGKQVRFAAIELNDKKAVFENKLHDFPQRIVYSKTSGTTIDAYVEGIQNGKLRKEEFHFKRKE